MPSTTRVRRKKSAVVSLFGAAIPLPQVNDEVMERLGELLAKGRSGQIAGFAYVRISPEGHVSTSWVGDADKHSLVAGAVMLAHRITAQACE